MGLSGISIFQLSVVLLLCIVLFGTKRILQAANDLGSALRQFRQGLQGVNQDPPDSRGE